MVGSGRTVGIILIALSVIVFLATAVLMGAQLAGGDTTIGGAALGVALITVFVCLPLLAAGIWFYTKGRREVCQNCKRRVRQRTSTRRSPTAWPTV